LFEELKDHFKGFVDLWDLMSKDSQDSQRSTLRWLKEGDANSSYFHLSIKLRRSRKSIVALRVGNMWVESALNIMFEIVNYFRDHFYESTRDRPTLDGVKFLGVSLFDIGEFRPISLVGSLYKIAAKVLTGRLALVIDKLFSPNQSTFIRRRALWT